MCVCLAAPELQNTFCQLLKDKNYPHVFSTQINQTKGMNTLDRGTATSCIRNTFSWDLSLPYYRNPAHAQRVNNTFTSINMRTCNAVYTKPSVLPYLHPVCGFSIRNGKFCELCMVHFISQTRVFITYNLHFLFTVIFKNKSTPLNCT